MTTKLICDCHGKEIIDIQEHEDNSLTYFCPIDKEICEVRWADYRKQNKWFIIKEDKQ